MWGHFFFSKFFLETSDLGNVTEIRWRRNYDKFFTEGGEIHLKWLPESVERFDLYNKAAFCECA